MPGRRGFRQQLALFSFLAREVSARLSSRPPLRYERPRRSLDCVLLLRDRALNTPTCVFLSSETLLGAFPRSPVVPAVVPLARLLPGPRDVCHCVSVLRQLLIMQALLSIKENQQSEWACVFVMVCTRVELGLCLPANTAVTRGGGGPLLRDVVFQFRLRSADNTAVCCLFAILGVGVEADASAV